MIIYIYTHTIMYYVLYQHFFLKQVFNPVFCPFFSIPGPKKPGNSQQVRAAGRRLAEGGRCHGCCPEMWID